MARRLTTRVEKLEAPARSRLSLVVPIDLGNLDEFERRVDRITTKTERLIARITVLAARLNTVEQAIGS